MTLYSLNDTKNITGIKNPNLHLPPLSPLKTPNQPPFLAVSPLPPQKTQPTENPTTHQPKETPQKNLSPFSFSSAIPGNIFNF